MIQDFQILFQIYVPYSYYLYATFLVLISFYIVNQYKYHIIMNINDILMQFLQYKVHFSLIYIGLIINILDLNLCSITPILQYQINIHIACFLQSLGLLYGLHYLFIMVLYTVFTLYLLIFISIYICLFYQYYVFFPFYSQNPVFTNIYKFTKDIHIYTYSL